MLPPPSEERADISPKLSPGSGIAYEDVAPSAKTRFTLVEGVIC